ncbi:deoxyribonuclease IV [Mycoplasmopsis opalescens]|uniref:deoxyribonuclease IV n=1 Tax=Mycoplasmopsis opalescens TaxID=114886 RepID=UPI0004A6F4BC|nr:deoxyribonuclease IV [Mycoplasmopsis opalescens]
MIKLGSHVAFKAPNYLIGSIEESLSYNANTCMIFLGPPQRALRVSTEKYHKDEYMKKYSHIINPEDIVVHAPYIINMCSSSKGEKAVEFLISEIERMNFVGFKYLVLHPGSATDCNRKQALDNLVNNLLMVINNTKDVVICLETMAGKGNEMFVNIEEMKYVLAKTNHERIQICLDTCHLHDSGIDFNNYEEFKRIFDANKLTTAIKVIHVNDSKNACGSHKDRHENIGKGTISVESLRKVILDPDFAKVIKVLETPYIDNKAPYKEEIALLLKEN